MTTICIFGDSITYGSVDPEKGGWVTQLRNYFESKDADTEVYNLGICGDTTEGLLQRFETECAVRNPSVIIFAIGINDSLYLKSSDRRAVELTKFKANLKELIKKAQKLGNKIFFAGLTKVDESKTSPLKWDADRFYDNKTIREYNSAIKSVCSENNISFLELFPLLTETDLFDGLHPNSKGHKKMFDAIKEFLISEILPNP